MEGERGEREGERVRERERERGREREGEGASQRERERERDRECRRVELSGSMLMGVMAALMRFHCTVVVTSRQQ